MENLNKFINEILNIEIRSFKHPLDPGSNYLSVSHYNADSGYKNILYPLQVAARTDINNLSIEQQKQQLKHLEEIEARVLKAELEWIQLEALFISGKRIDKSYLDNESFFRFLQIPNYNPGKINADFIYDLREALVEKIGFVAGLIYQVNELLGLKEQDTLIAKNPSNKNIGEWIAHPKQKEKLKNKWIKENLVTSDIFIPGCPVRWFGNTTDLINQVKNLLPPANTPSLSGLERDYIKIITSNFLQADGEQFDPGILKRTAYQMTTNTRKWQKKE